MVVELEWKGSQMSEAMNSDTSSTWSADSEMIFLRIEQSFSIFFFTDIVLRVLAFGSKFFCNVMNVLDTIVVALSIVEEIAREVAGMRIPDVKLLRIIRLTKLVKAVRIMRVMRVFHPLRVLMVSIVSSIGALVWSMALLLVIQAIAAVGITQLLQEFLANEENDLSLRMEVSEWFGRWSYSMITMFEITIAPGAWAKPGRLLIFDVDPLYSIFLIPYVMGVTFAIMRVISALFLQETMNSVARDQDLVYQEKTRKRDKDVQKIREIFRSGDRDGGGTLCPKEFGALFKDPRMKVWLEHLGLDVAEVSGLFRLMDDGDGLVTFEEFLSGCLRLRGGAKSVDLATLLYENRKVISKIEALRRDMGIG
jgi:voltage-gated sodium channel